MSVTSAKTNAASVNLEILNNQRKKKGDNGRKGRRNKIN